MIDPSVLARIEGLPLRVKFVSDEIMQGLHRSRRLGANIEFAEHKLYTPGDDIRHIDWKAFARRDKLSIKRFEEEMRIAAYLILDASCSMAYQGTGKNRMSKFSYAQVLAGCLAYLMLHGRDAVGFGAVSERLSHFVPPQANESHLHAMVREMEMVTPEKVATVREGLIELLQKIIRKSLLVFFSDLLFDREHVLDLFKRLRQGTHDVVIFHVLDREEVEFPFSEVTRFEHLETGEKVVADARSIRKKYVEEFGRFLAEMRAACLRQQVDYQFVVTDEPPDQVLLRFLHPRMQKH